MKFTLNQAAEETGKSKSVISNAIKNGKLSADKVKNPKTGRYSYSIDAAELFRVYERVEQPKNTEKNKSEHTETEKKAIREMRRAQRELELMKEKVQELREDKEYLKKQLSKSFETTKLITNQMQAQPKKKFWIF